MGKNKKGGQMMRYKYREALWVLSLIMATFLMSPQTGFARNNIYHQYYQLNIDISGDGQGIVRGPDIKCANDCSRQYRSGSFVALIAKPAKDSEFAGWSGCDMLAHRICIVKMNGAKSVMATFSQIMPEPPLLTASLNALTAPALIGSTGTVLANIKLLNSSVEDIRLTSITFTYVGPLYAIQNVKLYNGAVQIGPTIGMVSGNGEIMFHNLDVIIPGSSSTNLTVKADISLSATSGDTITFSISNTSDIMATGIASGCDASIMGTPINVTTVISSSILQVFLNPGAPSTISWGYYTEVMRLGFFANSWGEYVLVDSITVSFTGIIPGDLTNIRLLTPWYTQIGDAVPILDNNGKATFQNLNWVIPPGNIQELRVHADFFPNRGGVMAVSIQHPSDISAIGLTTATTTLIGGNFPLIWNIMY